MNTTEKNEFYKELFSLAIPIGLQNLLIALIGATDALMLGRLAQDAVSLANQIVFIMNLFFFTLAMLIPEQLMRIYTPDKALIEIGASYLRAVGISYLFSGITQCYYLKMKVEGKAPKSVIMSVVILVADVALDIFLIYGLAGMPKLGANGSAYSTVVVELIALVWCIIESLRNDSIRVDRQGLKWFSTWCFALPLALLGTFVFHWPVIIVYILMCIDEIIKVPFLYPRYKKYLWLNNLTRDEK